ncbi:MAG: CorA family divalent cation transporter [Methylococcales bacterium]
MCATSCTIRTFRLYDKDFPLSPDADAETTEENFVAHFEYDLQPDQEFYTFAAPVNNNQTKRYRLHIESIILHLYNTGIGVLSFHLNNRDEKQKNPEDILRINQFGRRIYPPFLSVPPELIGTPEQYHPGGFREGLEGVQQRELASELSILGEPTDNFVPYALADDFRDGIFMLPAFMQSLFVGVPVITSECRHNIHENSIRISPVLDDRMFVVCWYGNDDIANEIRGNSDYKAIKNNGKFAYLTNEWLYKYAFVDVASLSCQNEEMRENAMKDHVNARWVNYGTLYAATRYSFVCLTQPLTDDGFRKYSGFVVNHVQTMYYKIVELCLVQRACLLRFSDEVAEISSMKASENRYLSKKVSSLYKSYIRFVNKIYFREVTAQEQGIELYNLLQDKMRIAEHVKDLDKEIEELHTYLALEEQKEQSSEIATLTRLAAFFLPGTLIAGILGMNDLVDTFSINSFFLGTFSQETSALLLNIALIVVGILIGLFIAIRKNRKIFPD